MRHVPIAVLKDKLSEIVAAAEAGEEIVITRHGRDIVRLVGLADDRLAKQRKVIDDLFALGQTIRATQGPTSAEDIRAMIDDGRR